MNTRSFIVIAIAFAVVIGIGAAGTVALSGYVRERKQEKLAAKQATDSVRKFLEGKDLGDRPNFPDTTVGRMSGISYDLYAKLAANEKDLTAKLEKMRWDWVMTPESLRTKANLEKSLTLVNEAGAAMKEYRSTAERTLDSALASMEAAATDESGRKFLAGFKSSVAKPKQGLYYLREISTEITVNHSAIRDALRLLLSISGKYTVDDDGGITMADSVSDKTRDAYNAAQERITKSMERIIKLDAERIQTAKGNLDRLKSK